MEISVIVPCYNSFHLMQRCLTALEDQTYKDFEVIVIDDCSSDDSYKKLCEYSKKTTLAMRVYQTSENVGPGEARNIAIKQAQGEYLTFCDSDDWYELNYLERMYKTLKKEKAEVIMCNYQKIFDNGKREQVDYTRALQRGKQGRYVALSKSSLCLLMFSKSLMDGIKIPHIKNGEDIAVIPVILGRAKRVTSIPDVLYNYYIRNNSLSNRSDEKVYKSLLTAYRFIEERLNEEKYADELEFIGVRTVLYGCVLNAFKSKTGLNEIKNIVEEFSAKHKHWDKNKYISEFGGFQKLYIWCVRMRAWRLLALLSKVHYIYTTR